MRPASVPEALLIAWLHRLVALLLAAGGAAARQLEHCVLGRQAGLQLDEACLLLEATRGSAGELSVSIVPAEQGADPTRRLLTSGQALRDVIEGRALLDAAVADGRIDLRAPLELLLTFHELVLSTLALAPRSPGLRALWAEFDATWPVQPAPCAPLERQLPRHGQLVSAVPEPVRLARSPAAGRAAGEPASAADHGAPDV